MVLPDWLVPTILSIVVPLAIVYGTKKITAQSSLIQQMTVKHEAELKNVGTTYEAQITVMRNTFDAQFAALNDQVARLKDDVASSRAEVQQIKQELVPTRAENRALYDYVGVLRRGYQDLGHVAPSWPTELRER